MVSNDTAYTKKFIINSLISYVNFDSNELTANQNLFRTYPVLWDQGGDYHKNKNKHSTNWKSLPGLCVQYIILSTLQYLIQVRQYVGCYLVEITAKN